MGPKPGDEVSEFLVIEDDPQPGGIEVENIVPVKKVLTLGYLLSTLRHTNRGVVKWFGGLGETLVTYTFLSRVRLSFQTGEMLFIISKQQ